ncbi:MAG: cobaltochelatase subunit CobN [Bryobacterales bacterium]|nr:cobaltochelatase subunit CobN [Bryobacterales bacterium]
MRSLAILVLASAAVHAEAPLRVTVLTRLNQVMAEAQQRFAERWGPGRIHLRYGDFESPPMEWESSDVIFTYLMPGEAALRLAPRFKAAIARGARVVAHWPEPALRHWDYRQDETLVKAAAEYWSLGGAENVARCLAFLYVRVAHRGGIAVEPPEAVATVGIYHPRAQRPFVALDAYLEWHRGLRVSPPDAPRVGILFYHTSLKNKDTAHLDALIAAAEKQGLVPVPVFGWPPPLAEPLLVRDGKPAVEAAFALNLGFSRPGDTEFLARMNVHVIGLMTTRQSLADWTQSRQGLQPDQLAIQVASPERAGATDPITFAATERSPDGKSQVSVPIPERIDMAVRRAARWIALGRKPNPDKRIAILYYNNPPGKGNIGASYLDVPGSLAAILHRLRQEGYLTGDHVPEEKELLAMLERAGRNIEEWAPGELDEIVSRRQAVLISMKQYRKWLSATPKEFQDALLRNWGPPEKSRLMTVRSRDNEPFFVLPALRFGNIFLGPQPLRSAFANAGKTLHDTTIPPPHGYVAGYLWLRHVFRADAITHLGRHGSLEFLPGKNVGMAGWDPSEVLMGDTPAPYFYIIDGGGESTTARRRAASTLIGHLTPLTVSGGAQDEFRALRNAFLEIEKVRDASPALLAEYQETAVREIRRLRLDRQLGFDVGRADWSEIASAIGTFLEETEAGPIPMGIHRLGRLPRDEIQIESLAEFFKTGFPDPELRQLGDLPLRWAEALFRGARPEIDPRWPAALRDRVSTQLAAGASWLANLRNSARLELENYVRILRGEYQESGSSGDPLRVPASLPGGRNLHDFDPSLIPTPAACEVGRKLGDEVLRRHRERTGRLPDKVSMVLWYGETIRHQGALECEALYLMGVEPKWNSRGVVDGLRLIPDAELGRPRVDVVLTIAGIYRDGFPDKALLLDSASLMVQKAGENTLSRNTRRARDELLRSGLAPELAEKAASARVFGPAPGDYGGGIASLIKQSRDAGNSEQIADAYLRHNNFAYGAAGWGELIPRALETQIKGNEVVVHSRSTNLYGVTDNDDFFDFAGGLSLATRKVNGGAAPQLYVANLRKAGRERLDDFKTFLATEMNSRFWNPKWIREMQKSGYGGAREIFDHLENVYGWQATTPEHVDGAYWDRTFEVYVQDKHNLGLAEFFEKANPHARQYMLARMLEVDRQGSHAFTHEQKEQLLREYVRSVARFGVGCSANTCGNRKLQAAVAAQAGRLPDLKPAEIRQFRARLRQAFSHKWPVGRVAPSGGSADGVAGGTRMVRPSRPFRVFHAVMPRPSDPVVAVPVGLAALGLFLASSWVLGALQAAVLRWRKSSIQTLWLNRDS